MQKNNSKSAPRRWSWGTFFLTIPVCHLDGRLYPDLPLGVVMFYALTDPATGLFSLDNLSKIFTGAFPRIFLRSDVVLPGCVSHLSGHRLSCRLFHRPAAAWGAAVSVPAGHAAHVYELPPADPGLGGPAARIPASSISSWGCSASAPLPLIRTTGAVILGMVYNYLPYMILPLYTVIMKIDPLLIEAAAGSGVQQPACICPGHPPPVHAPASSPESPWCSSLRCPPSTSPRSWAPPAPL